MLGEVALTRAVEPLEDLYMGAIMLAHRLEQVPLLLNNALRVFNQEDEVFTEQALGEILLVLLWQWILVSFRTIKVPKREPLLVFNILVHWLDIIHADWLFLSGFLLTFALLIC